MFSRFKDFVKKNSVENSDSGADQCVKDHLANLQPRLSRNFPQAVSDEYKWITDPFHAVSPRIYDSLSLLKKKKTILTLYLTLL
jgi:hypothetical protein